MLEYVGHITYQLYYRNGDVFSLEKKFTSFDQLFHHTSFVYLRNLQTAYEVDEVQITNVFIQGFSFEDTQDVVLKLDAMDSSLANPRFSFGEEHHLNIGE